MPAKASAKSRALFRTPDDPDQVEDDLDQAEDEHEEDASFHGPPRARGARLDYSVLRALAAEGSNQSEEKQEEEEETKKEHSGEEVHGEYERDASDATPLSKQSFLSHLKADDHLRFLAMAPLTRGDALRNMSPLDRIIFEVIVLLTPLLLIRKIWQFAQKSAQWLWARTARLTGSHTSIAVGHQRGTPIMKGPYESIYFKFKGNRASMWGSGKEVYATQCYCNDFNRIVTNVFREQRRSGQIQETMEDGEHNGYFIFRNQKIPVADINDEPSVEVRHYGLLIDPWNHHRGVSPDGVVFINGLAVGVLEVKCAYAQDKSLYVNIKPYYIDQIMSELYLGHLYWPTAHWVDFVVWSPQHFTVDTFTFDAAYYYGWYAPRELKYYFRIYLKTLSERLYHVTQEETKNSNPTLEDVRRQAEKDFVMPEAPPPPPPSTFAPAPASPTAAAAAPLDPDWQQHLLQIDLDA